MTSLAPIQSTPRATQARILFTLVLALALVFPFAAYVAIPASAEAVEPLKISVSLDKTTVAAGESVTATWTASGGREPYSSYTYVWNVKSGGCWFEKKRATVSGYVTPVSFTPDMGESGYVRVYVEDADGRTSSDTQYYEITGFEAVPPLEISVSLDKTTVAAGESVTATWTASGGREPYSSYTYVWNVKSGGYWFEKKRATVSGYVTPVSFTPDMGESGYVRVYVKDADGRTISDTQYYEITGFEVVPPLEISVSLDKTAAMVGEPVITTWTASGGCKPYSSYTYIWNVKSGGYWFEKKRATISGNVTSASFTPDMGEECSVSVHIKDADGRTTSAYKRIPLYIYAKGVTLDCYDSTMDIGDSMPLTATITPSSGTIQTISWSSSNPSVTTVDGSGRVTAVGEGKATITASTVDGSGLFAECEITVNPPIPVASVSITGPDGSLAVGGRYRLAASVLPADATYKTITWSTSNPNIATVQQDGLVSGIAKGSAVITATAPGGAKADWNVTVSSTASRLRAFAHDPGLTVAYSRWCLYFKVGAQYGVPPYTLDVLVEKDGVQVAKTALTANGSTDLTFTGILSTAVYTMKVTATDAEGRTDSASCSVDVYVGGGNLNVKTLSETEPVSALTGLSFQNPTPTVAIGSTLTLSPVVAPSGATRPNFEWFSSNPAAVTVSDTGVASAIAEGTSVITAYATDGSGLSASCKVTAIRPVTSITLNQGSAKLTSIGQTVTLQEAVLPADASDRSVIWSTSNAAVATVNGGVVTAKGDGTATITATAKDGTGKSASCAITVDTSIPVASVAIEALGVPLYYGGKIQLKTTILPANATDKTLVWTSSNPHTATVENGTVTSWNPGRTTITATAKSGVKATCEVVVSSTASRLRAFAYDMHVETSPTGIYLTVGAQHGSPPYDIDITLNQNGVPLHGMRTALNHSGSVAFQMGTVPAAEYTAIATVTDAKGRVDTASTTCYMYAQGADISCTSYNEVLPYSTLTGIRFESASASVAIGQDILHSVVLSPANTPYPGFEWSSSNPAVATVTEIGIVQGVAKGSSVITASTVDGSGLSASYTVTVYRDVDSVSIDQSPKGVKLKQGETATLTATVLPADASFRTISWSSGNPSVATVSNGVVTGLRDGTTAIWAITPNSKGASCIVTVSNKILSIDPNLPKDLPLVNGAYELNLKGTLQLSPRTDPAAVGASFAYKSSNSKTLSVTKQGLVKGLKAGTCTLTISARNTSTTAPITKAFKLRVIVPASSVKMDPGFTIFEGKSRKLKASVSPSSATYRKLEWSSSNPSVATVDGLGNVYGVSLGTAAITATAHNGVYTTRQVRVTHPVGSISLAAPVRAIYVRKTAQVTPTVLPNTADAALKWTSSSTKIATVNQSGLVMGKTGGTVRITAAAKDGSKKSGSLVLKVVKPASSISIRKSMTLFTNGNATAKLAVTASPAKTGYLSMTWSSDNPSVASVDQNGVVTAHADGTAVIRATTDLGKTATCSVTVLTYPSYIKLNLPGTLRVGEKLRLIPPLVELNGSMRALTWKSYNTSLATIDKKGLLAAKKPGYVEIRGTTANRLSAKVKLKITR